MPILIYITCASKEEARRIARELIEKKLMACANIFPIESIYWWKNAIEEATEYVIIAKAMETDFEELEQQAKHLHSYEVPCIVAVPITNGNQDYLTWIEASTQNKH